MGRAAAECFAADGARVAVLARGAEALDETASSLSAGRRAVTWSDGQPSEVPTTVMSSARRASSRARRPVASTGRAK